MAEKKATIIIGAGLAGLSTAYHLKSGYRLFESANQVGGICKTDKRKGFAFDHAGHLLHLKTKQIKNLVKRLGIIHWQQHVRDARIVIMGKTCRYPFQSNLFNLPPDIKAKAILDYLNAATNLSNQAINNFEQWSNSSFGKTITELFLKPYNEKLWTVPASTLTLDWMSNYFPKPDVKRVVAGAFNDVQDGGGYNATFNYPKQGGIGQLADCLAKKVKPIQLQSRVTQVDIKNHTVQINGHQLYTWKRLVSTMPLPALIATIKGVPLSIKQALKKLNWNSVMVINLGIKRAHVHHAHWLYFPEHKFIFYRVGFPSNFGQIAPKNHSSLYVEVALEAGTGWEKRASIIRRAKRDLIKSGILKPSDQIVMEHTQYIPYAYAIFDQYYRQSRKRILDYLRRNHIYSIGRWGNWEYSAMEDALLAGAKIAKTIKQGAGHE